MRVPKSPSSYQRPSGRPHARIKRRWWVWRSTQAWWTSFLFLLGTAVLLSYFAKSHARLIWEWMLNEAKHRSLLVLGPYFLGSSAYSAGCIAALYSQYWQDRMLAHQKRHARRSDKEPALATSATTWAKVDFIGAAMACAGGLSINWACYTDLYLGSTAELVFTTDESVLWRITVPTMLGRALFMVAGYLTWAARNKSLSLFVRHASPHFWWTSVLFWVGATGFYLGWFFIDSPFELAPGLLVKNWFWVLLGYVAGSCCLLAASYVMVLEIAQAPPPQVVADLSLPLGTV